MGEMLAVIHLASGLRRFAVLALVFYLFLSGAVHSAPVMKVAGPADAGGEQEFAESLFASSEPSLQSEWEAAASTATEMLEETLVTVDMDDVFESTAVTDSEIEKYSQELFEAIMLVKMLMREQPAANKQSGSGPGSNGVASSVPAVGQFILGDDTNAIIDLEFNLEHQPGGQPAARRQVKFERWKEPEGGESPKQIPLKFADASASQSILHRVMCIIGLLSPESGGMNEDCEYETE